MNESLVVNDFDLTYTVENSLYRDGDLDFAIQIIAQYRGHEIKLY